jgi:hypothetical protein
MAARSKNSPRFLLTVASAGVLLPGCAQQHDYDDAGALQGEEDERDAYAVGVVAPPDGGQLVPPYDAGRWSQGAILQPDSGWPTDVIVHFDAAGPELDAGVMVLPDEAGPPVGTVPRPDAGPADASAACEDLSHLPGLLLAPPDASCVPRYCSGFFVRPEDVPREAGCIPRYAPGIVVRDGDDDE